MSHNKVNKRKIFNDPVYGFVTIPNELIFDLIEHPCFQRLRRIKQLGLTHLVYPGALHTRFQHSLGALYLMLRVLNELRFKGHDITHEEYMGAAIAILLHDVGHGPYSHALEHSIVDNIPHESISKLIMDKLNASYNNKLEVALEIFNKTYPKKFLSTLVSGQFDMDRLDYLKRDSFFTGVSEGNVNYERLLSMVDVNNDEVVIQAKGIYSVEKFITARRIMYWQVYLHKTVLVAEYTLMNVLKRAKELRMSGKKLFATPALDFFLSNNVEEDDFTNDPRLLETFWKLDDYDISTAMKVWIDHDDFVLSYLCKCIINRKLFKIEIQNRDFDQDKVNELKEKVIKKYNLNNDDVDYFVISDTTSNYTYKPGSNKINIIQKDGVVKDIAEASDELNISMFDKPTIKHFLAYPKDLY